MNIIDEFPPLTCTHTHKVHTLVFIHTGAHTRVHTHKLSSPPCICSHGSGAPSYIPIVTEPAPGSLVPTRPHRHSSPGLPGSVEGVSAP